MWSLQRHRRPGDHPCVWAPATPPPLSRPDHTHVPRQTQCHPYCHRAIVPPGVRQSVCCARLFPCLRPPERHTSRPDACVEDRSRHQPGRPYAPATGAGTPHATQRLPHCAVPSVKGRKPPRQRYARRCTGAQGNRRPDRSPSARAGQHAIHRPAVGLCHYAGSDRGNCRGFYMSRHRLSERRSQS